ncbi:hypothetical protein B1750_gp375 [Noumeavirus]|uniref:hypothetical protein n=1 Tax=Noumeavirus TaxID=1955558 RepID=UPI000982C5FD|nr:hypothetical protein B1750_gp375 [Noumeavirus]AQM73356.1 hypothetical protein NMV_375 [Noumeavirus]
MCNQCPKLSILLEGGSNCHLEERFLCVYYNVFGRLTVSKSFFLNFYGWLQQQKKRRVLSFAKICASFLSKGRRNIFVFFFTLQKMQKTNAVFLLGTLHEGSWFFKVSDKEKDGKHLICSLLLEEPVYIKGISTPERVRCWSLQRAVNAFRDSCQRVGEEEAIKLTMKTRERVGALEKAVACCQEAGETQISCLREMLDEERQKYLDLKKKANRVQISQFKAKKLPHSGGSLVWDCRYSSCGSFEEDNSDVEF